VHLDFSILSSLVFKKQQSEVSNWLNVRNEKMPFTTEDVLFLKAD
jgi:hypothetical protein